MSIPYLVDITNLMNSIKQHIIEYVDNEGNKPFSDIRIVFDEMPDSNAIEECIVIRYQTTDVWNKVTTDIYFDFEIRLKTIKDNSIYDLEKTIMKLYNLFCKKDTFILKDCNNSCFKVVYIKRFIDPEFIWDRNDLYRKKMTFIIRIENKE